MSMSNVPSFGTGTVSISAPVQSRPKAEGGGATKPAEQEVKARQDETSTGGAKTQDLAKTAKQETDNEVQRLLNRSRANQTNQTSQASEATSSTTQEAGASYTVKQGDTLGAIAKANGVSLADLKQLNPDLFKDGKDASGKRRSASGGLIYPGDSIKLPAKKGSAPADKPAEKPADKPADKPPATGDAPKPPVSGEDPKKPEEKEEPKVCLPGDALVDAALKKPSVAGKWTLTEQKQVLDSVKAQVDGLMKVANDETKPAKDRLKATQDAIKLADDMLGIANRSGNYDLAEELKGVLDKDAAGKLAESLKVKAGDGDAVKTAVRELDPGKPEQFKALADQIRKDQPALAGMLDTLANPALSKDVRDELMQAVEDNRNTAKDLRDAVKEIRNPADAEAVAGIATARGQTAFAANVKAASEATSEGVRENLYKAIGGGTFWTTDKGALQEARDNVVTEADQKAFATVSGNLGGL
ncbi:MAG: LysM peptidoglycan-binding domain-containing protein [Candidatus Sericytochromatia bacterium]|nr:LysM peptidoglycan-binding domain-containing protein [Candidatus Sericytochromatia bacterium]